MSELNLDPELYRLCNNPGVTRGAYEKCGPSGSNPQGFCLSGFGLGPWNPDFSPTGCEAGVPQPAALILHVQLPGYQACLVEVNVLVIDCWGVPSPESQDTREHLHACWLVFLHQKPAGSMEAELTVGIWAVIKVGHHCGSHRRVCGRERRHLAQTHGLARHVCSPSPTEEQGCPAGWDFWSLPACRPQHALSL